MRISLIPLLACAECEESLALEGGAEVGQNEIRTGRLQCANKHVFEIRDFVPRFVPSRNYASSFGLQWTRFARAQLDEELGIPLSRDRFFAETRWPTDLRGQTILEAGAGAGRFTAHAASTGATVVSLDYTEAIDAARDNNQRLSNVHYVQADIRRLPLRRGAFDKVYCFGVLQHTPEPEAAFRGLLPPLRAGGELVFDVYRRSWRTFFAGRYYLRPLTTRIPSARLLDIVRAYVTVVFPLSRLLHAVAGRRARAVSALLAVADYRDVLPLPEQRLFQLSVLDTFDALSPVHDRPQTLAAVRRWLRDAKLANPEVTVGYNGIEGRGTKT